MKNGYQTKLEKLGLSPVQARVYLTLAHNPTGMGGSALAAAAGVPRPSVYPALESLVEKGMVEDGEGYGSRFAPIAPEKALPPLIAAEREKLAEYELLSAELIKNLRFPADQAQEGSEAKLIEVLRHPRIRGERFQELQRETERQVDTLVGIGNIPAYQRRSGNPALCESLRRGIRHRVIYEPAQLEHEYIAPFLKGWSELGEEARIYKGHLPLKLVLFDDKVAWMPLEVSASRYPVTTVLIRHHAVAQTLRLLFDHLWNQSEPLRLGTKRARPPRRHGKGVTTKK